MTALEREWAAKLKASGFQDLEGADRDGALSRRGLLHPVDDTAEEDAALADRMRAGEAQTEWRLSVLHTHKFRNATERRVWQLYAEGIPLRAIATQLGCSYKRVRETWHEIDSRVRQNREGNRQWKNRSRQRRNEVEQMVRRCDRSILTKLAEILLLSMPKVQPTRRSR